MKYPIKTLVVSSAVLGAIGLGLAPNDRLNSIGEIRDEQVRVFMETGKYQRFEKNQLPDGVTVDEYVSLKGAGYQLRWEDENFYYSEGVGPESVERTYTTPKERPPLATSTRL